MADTNRLPHPSLPDLHPSTPNTNPVIRPWEHEINKSFVEKYMAVNQNMGNRTHRYMLQPIPLASIRTIDSMRLSSHALQCESGALGHRTSDESGRLCTLCPKQVRESEYHTSIHFSAFYHIRPCFPHIFGQAQSLREFLSQPQCALSIAIFIGNVLEHWESLLTFTRVTWNVIFLVSYVIFDLRRR